MQTLKEWLAFTFIGLVWGSAYYWNKIALHEIDTTTIAFYRLWLGAGLLLLFLFLKQKTITFPRRYVLHYLFMGSIASSIPIMLICWSELFIDSALAAILNSTVPLFSMVIAHYFLRDKITLHRFIGLLIGFMGVFVLIQHKINIHDVHGSTLGIFAGLFAAALYALGFSFARKYLSHHSGLEQATWAILAGAVMMTAAWFVMSHNTPLIPANVDTWIALIWMGALATSTAYALFFYLNQCWGVTRASLVSYTFPIVGITLGVLLLNEPLEHSLFLGGLLIVIGIALVNRRDPFSFSKTKTLAEGKLL